MQRIVLSLLGEHVVTSDVADALTLSLGHNYAMTRHRDACCIVLGEGEAWLFDYAVLVCWNLGETQRLQLAGALSACIVGACHREHNELYQYEVVTDGDFRVRNDVIRLPSADTLVRLAVSHALAQSAKLSFFEDSAKAVIEEQRHVSKTLAETGKLPLSRKEVSKLRGVLFATSSDITLHFGLLDTPEFFWDYPELEHYYLGTAKYLDLAPRLVILQQKLSTIHDLASMLAEEHRHKHSAFLEWIIIVLIAVDIMVYFLPSFIAGH